MLYSSPIGTLSLLADNHYLFGIWVEEESDFERELSEKAVTVVESHPVLNQIISYLDTYFKGQDPDLSELPLAPVGSDFEKRVWNYLRRIPFGMTVTLWTNSQGLAGSFCSSNRRSSRSQSLVYPCTLSSCARCWRPSDRLCLGTRKEGLALET